MKSIMCVGALLLGLTVISTAYSDNQALHKSAKQHGEYIAKIAGCYSCHTDSKHNGAAYAGGRQISTPFGIFITPNITPDIETGIGKWDEQTFVQALREGIGRKNEQLYPVFPYTAYTQINNEDLHALWLYLQSRTAVKQVNKSHILSWPYSNRYAIQLWKMLYFKQAEFHTDTRRSRSWNRGAYLVESILHCDECHSPRNWLGAIKYPYRFAGTNSGPEDSSIPNITQDIETGIGKWSKDELLSYLETGMLPNGDTTEGLMDDVIEDGVQYLSKRDLTAVVDYLQSLPPIVNLIH